MTPRPSAPRFYYVSCLAEPVRRRVTAPDGIRLAIREYAAAGRPTVLLLHGYPDNQRVWDRVVPLLADRFRVVTYDVRGAGDSDAPRGRSAYTLRTLTRDLVAVLDAVSPTEPVHLVGHDWGSIQLWEPVTEPALAHRIASFTSIGGPCLEHGRAWMRRQWRHPRGWPGALGQLRRSWYIVFFQLPLLPELCWRSGLAGRLLRWAERLPAPPAAADGRHGLALYRANFARRQRPHPRPPGGRPHTERYSPPAVVKSPARVAVDNPEACGQPVDTHGERRTGIPVLLVVATRDRFIDPRLVAEAARWAPRLRRRTVRAGHWLPYSHPGRLAAWIDEFVTDIGRTTDISAL